MAVNDIASFVSMRPTKQEHLRSLSEGEEGGVTKVTTIKTSIAVAKNWAHNEDEGKSLRSAQNRSGILLMAGIPSELMGTGISFAQERLLTPES
eukprot:Skav204004  [mRNA]  locus=scaffold210:40715:40996:+ [translate_table: standard]